MEQALSLLDDCEAHQLGAQLDLAICRVREAIGREEAGAADSSR
jgi:hypothetical protein